MKKIVCLLIGVLVLLANVAGSIEIGPTESLKPVLNGLTEVLADESLKGDEHLLERRKKIMESISRGFHFREMSKRVLGKTWRKIDEQQRDYFTELMTKLLENVYIGKLEGYSGQAVKYKAEKIKGKRAQVTTCFDHRDVEIPVHYIMKKVDNKWMVYDINIEGVSLIRNYNQQFKSILRKEQFDGLVKILEEKNKSFLNEQ